MYKLVDLSILGQCSFVKKINHVHRNQALFCQLLWGLEADDIGKFFVSTPHTLLIVAIIVTDSKYKGLARWVFDRGKSRSMV